MALNLWLRALNTTIQFPISDTVTIGSRAGCSIDLSQLLPPECVIRIEAGVDGSLYATPGTPYTSLNTINGTPVQQVQLRPGGGFSVAGVAFACFDASETAGAPALAAAPADTHSRVITDPKPTPKPALKTAPPPRPVAPLPRGMEPPLPPPGGPQYRFADSGQRRREETLQQGKPPRREGIPRREAAREEYHGQDCVDGEIEYTGERDGGLAVPIVMGVGGVILWFFSSYLALAVWLGTTIWAVITVVRLHFGRYNLSGVSGLPSAIVGCLGLWCVAFPWFWINRDRILSKAALRREQGDGVRLGTVLLMIASLACGAISAMVFVFFLILPSIWNMGVQAQQEEVLKGLRNYCSAQEVFLQEGHAAVPGNNGANVGYCDNFQNLYYGVDASGRQLRLVDEDFANAYAAPTQGAETIGGRKDFPEVYHGYLFFEDPAIAENGDWSSNFALIAYPILPGFTGSDLFWIDRDGVIKKRPAAGYSPGSLTAEESPIGGGAGDWVDAY